MSSSNHTNKEIAVLIPCKDEELTVGKVVKDFRKELHGSNTTVYVFDNNSTDNTVEEAKKAGATVIHSQRAGKGNVIKHMFSIVEADIYVMVDGDDTYPANALNQLMTKYVESEADMVIGMRLATSNKQAFRWLHKFGNQLITKLTSALFSIKITDILSGYRIFSRHFVKTVVLKSARFEIETEMTLQALIKNYVVMEVPISYDERPDGSISKLNTFKDGMNILRVIIMIFKDYKPLSFFSFLSALSLILGLAAGWLPILDYIQNRFVVHVPLTILAASLVLLSVLFIGIGLILNTITHFHIESQVTTKNIMRMVDREKNRSK